MQLNFRAKACQFLTRSFIHPLGFQKNRYRSAFLLNLLVFVFIFSAGKSTIDFILGYSPVRIMNSCSYTSQGTKEKTSLFDCFILEEEEEVETETCLFSGFIDSALNRSEGLFLFVYYQTAFEKYFPQLTRKFFLNIPILLCTIRI